MKAAEAKYTAMGETAEKLESTLKNFKGTADLCYAAMRELHREIKKDQKDQRWAFPLLGPHCTIHSPGLTLASSSASFFKSLAHVRK